jgi:hypothetical protein
MLTGEVRSQVDANWNAFPPARVEALVNVLQAIRTRAVA